MSKITLTGLVNLQNETTAVGAINNNNATVTTAFDNTVSRDGSNPNTMQASLDMNSNHILNLPFPSNGLEPLRYGDLTSLLTVGTITVPSDRWALATGTADAILATYNPVNSSLTDGLVLAFRASGRNTTTTPTFAPDGLTAHTVTKAGGTPLSVGDIETNSEISVRYNLSNTRWEIVNTLLVGASTSSLRTPQQYGAIGNGVADDTTAIQTAINATPAGGQLYFPAGTYKISAAGSQCLLITKSINFVGEGAVGSVLSVAAGTGVDAIAIRPTSNTLQRGFKFVDFTITSAASDSNNLLNFDTTTGTTTGIAEVVIERVVLSDCAGSAILFGNNPLNTNGGSFNCTIGNCQISGRVKIDFAGDSIRLNDNIINVISNKPAVYVNQTPNAGNFIMSGNNCVGKAGAVVMINAVAPSLHFNEFEQQVTSTNGNNAIIEFPGTAATIDNAQIVGNTIQAIPSVGNPIPFFLSNCTNTVIDFNKISTPVSMAPINIAGSSATRIGQGNSFTPGTTAITDTGSATNFFTANGAVATVLGSVGPTGSHTTVQKWFTVRDSLNQTFYIPAF